MRLVVLSAFLLFFVVTSSSAFTTALRGVILTQNIGAACTSGVADITQDTTTQDYGSAGVMGQSFTPTTNTSIYSFVFYGGDGTSGTLTCRLGAGIDLSTTYLEEVTGVTAGVGAITIEFAAHSSLSAGTLYSVLCDITSGGWNPSIAAADPYGGETYTQQFAADNVWNTTSYATRDMRFIFNRCQ
jgi:hypothetical protein